MTRPKKKSQSARKPKRSLSELLNELTNTRTSSQFEKKVLEICDALEMVNDRNAPDVQKIYSDLSNFFDTCLSSNDKRKTLKAITTIADLHYVFGNTPKALMLFKGCIKAEADSSCKCCLWRYYTYFCDMSKNTKNLNEALDEINGFLHAQNQKKGEYYAIILFFKGKVQFDLEMYEDALRAFRKSLKTINKEKDNTDLTNPMLLYQIAKCHQALKDYQIAIQVYDNLLKKDYLNGSLKSLLAGIGAKLNRGLCFQEGKEYSKAYSVLSDFVNFMETDTRVSVFRMRCHILNEYHFQATQALDLMQDKFNLNRELALTSKPDLAKNQEAEIKMREAKNCLHDKEFKKTYFLLKEVISVRTKLYKGKLPDSNLLNLYPDLMRCCLKLNKPLEAIEYAEKSIGTFSKKQISDWAEKSMDINQIRELLDYYFYEAGCAYMSVEYNSEARQYFKKSFLWDKSSKSKDRTAIATRIHKVGRMSHSLGLYEKAIIYFEKTARILLCTKDASMELWALNVLHLAECYKSVGMYQKALEVLQKSAHLPFEAAMKAEMLIVASICHRRLGNVSEGWNKILEAEEMQHTVSGKTCPHSVASPIFLHKFVCSIEKFKSGPECEQQLNEIMKFDDNQEEQVLKMRNAFMKSYDFGDVRALLEYLVGYLQFVRMHLQITKMDFMEPVLKPMRENYTRFLNSSLITNFVKAKQVEQGTKDKFLLHIPLDECLEQAEAFEKEKERFLEGLKQDT